VSDDKLKNNPFGALASLRDQLPSRPEPVKKEAPRKGPARAVVRMERKGHGGKEVTLVSHLELSAKDLEKWLKELKGELGCGGRVEEDAIVLQGDQRERVPAALTKRGVVKVTIG
jgi:translation initiation factor 1